MSYHATIQTLFNMLAQANMADSDNSDREPWQVWQDCLQHNRTATCEGIQHSLGYYGCINAAIVIIAGQAIVDHWAECGEIDFSLANRNPREDAARYADLDKVPFGC